VSETFFWGKRKCHWRREIRTASNKQNEENITKIRQIVLENRRMTVRSMVEQVNIDRETVMKILTEDLDMRKMCAKLVPMELTEEQKQIKSQHLPRPFREARWHFGPCHHRWWNMGLPIRPWNEAAKCTMEDCQFPTTKKIPLVQIKSQNNVANFFILEGLFIMNLYQLDKQSTKFTIWKHWKGCVKRLDGNDPNFFPTTHESCVTTMHLLTRHCLCEGGFSY